MGEQTDMGAAPSLPGVSFDLLSGLPPERELPLTLTDLYGLVRGDFITNFFRRATSCDFNNIRSGV
jgi:hypothetical protein